MSGEQFVKLIVIVAMILTAVSLVIDMIWMILHYRSHPFPMYNFLFTELLVFHRVRSGKATAS